MSHADILTYVDETVKVYFCSEPRFTVLGEDFIPLHD